MSTRSVSGSTSTILGAAAPSCPGGSDTARNTTTEKGLRLHMNELAALGGEPLEIGDLSFPMAFNTHFSRT